jgi:hypothetical protein
MYTALLGCLTTPGLDGMRFALFLFNLSVFKDPYRKQVSRTTVRPWCHLFLRQQTWQEHLNSATVVVGGCGNRVSDFQAWVFFPGVIRRPLRG